jgi:NTE family protein
MAAGRPSEFRRGGSVTDDRSGRLERHITPRRASDIQDRLTEITFNGALLGEVRAIDFVSRLIDSGKLSRDRSHAPFGAWDRWRALSRLLYGRLKTRRLLVDDPQIAPVWASRCETGLGETCDSIGREGTFDLRRAYS